MQLVFSVYQEGGNTAGYQYSLEPCCVQKICLSKFEPVVKGKRDR